MPMNCINKYCKFVICIIASSLILELQSCSDNEPLPSPRVEADYYITLPATGESETLYLTGLTSPVTVNCEDSSWLDYKVSYPESGSIEIAFYSLENADKPRQQRVIISDTKGNSAIVNVSLSLNADNGVNDEDIDFLTDWENQKSVNIYYNRGISTVKTPWNKEVVITTLPEEIRNDVKKGDGWEMAFSLLGNTELDGANYFGLYNKYTGILRIFYYVSTVWNNGSEYCLEIDMGNKSSNVKYPFYNALTYAIPSSYSNLNPSMDLLGLGNVHTTFKTFITPHISKSSSVLQQGWIAFDVDASGYCPESLSWLKSNESINFSIKSTQTSLLTLCGGLTANIDGNFSQIEDATASTSSGVGKAFSQISKYGAQASGVVGAITKAIWGKDISGTIKGVAGVCNVISAIANKTLGNPYEEKAAVDSMAGKIELALTGEINLSGKISLDASNSCPPISLGASGFRQTSNFGGGVWSLKSSPVVYIVGDQMLGDVNRFTLLCLGNGKYGIGQGSAKNYNLRLVTFLDPESIELNINKNVFSDISDVKVLAANVCVYPQETAGHTAKYSNLLGLKRPSVKISGASSGVWRSSANGNSMKYFMVSASSLYSPAMYETENNCGVYGQAGSNYKYYGHLNNEFGKPYIQNPQILFPATSSETDAKLYDGEIPDLVVTVVISFKSGGKTFTFSQRYLPEVKVITGDAVKSKWEVLKKYKTKCLKGESINTVNGQPVKHASGLATVERILKIFDKTLK